MRTELFPPGFEEGLTNLTFLTPAGNRLEWMQGPEHTNLRLIYKPHAERRRDFLSRNFSSRDIHTDAFEQIRIEQLPDSAVSALHYDPFHSTIETLHASRARNHIDILTLADENAFAFSARAPLTFTFQPRSHFTIEDGCLWERFEDRGEDIISFVLFSSLETNRVRRHDDGSVVLQIFGPEALLIGAEENPAQLRRLRRRFAGRPFAELAQANETQLTEHTSRARPTLARPDFQTVADLNHRILLSGFDLGGACNSGFCRIYNLIWHRDGGLASAEHAAAGQPELARRWAPLGVGNPSQKTLPDGTTRTFYSQLVGTRWNKDEEDGWYYSVLSAHAHWRATGETSLLAPQYLDLLTAGLQTLLEETYIAPTTDHPAAGLFHCSARCEMVLPSDLYQGSDIVNGCYYDQPADAFFYHGQPVYRLWSLYINTLSWQGLKTFAALLRLAPAAGRTAQADRIEALAHDLETAILKRFLRPDGSFLAERLELADGTHHEVALEEAEMWEMNWALAMPPFAFRPELTLPALRKIIDHYTAAERRCYSPWPLQAALLREFQDAPASDAMLSCMVSDALHIDDTRYPLHGAIPERGGVTVTKIWPAWRPTLFCCAPFLRALSADLLAPLPFGLAARSGNLTTRLDRFVYRGLEINATTTGTGPEVGQLTVNGTVLNGTLQIPESLLRIGEPNTLEIIRADQPPGPRLHRSDALLRTATRGPDNSLHLELQFPVSGSLIWQGNTAALSANTPAGTTLPLAFAPVPGTRDLSITYLPTGPVHLHHSHPTCK